MTIHYCEPDACLVGARFWLPEAAHDYNWGSPNPTVGCNNLKCGGCGEKVQTEVQPDGIVRRYRCACQKRAQTGRLLLGSDEGQIWDFTTKWRCDGHPPLVLPATIDGIAINNEADLEAAAVRGLANPPFMPPDTDSPAMWVVRLYWILDSEEQRARIGRAVAQQLFSDDPVLVRSAFSFFWNIPSASGAERLAEVARTRMDFLARTVDPREPSATLANRLYQALQVRAYVEDENGSPIDSAALAVLRETALAGKNYWGLLPTLSLVDIDWLLEHALEIFAAGGVTVEELVIALGRGRARAIPIVIEIARLSDQANREVRAILEFWPNYVGPPSPKAVLDMLPPLSTPEPPA